MNRKPTFHRMPWSDTLDVLKRLILDGEISWSRSITITYNGRRWVAA